MPRHWALSTETRQRMSQAKRNMTQATKDRISAALKQQWAEGVRHGYPASAEHRHRMSAAAKRGPASHFWRGGLRDSNAAIRSSVEYKLWRIAVLEKDDYRCFDCGARGVRLHVDHILPFAQYPRLRFDVHNGRTLCVPCHRQTPTYLNRWSRSAANQVIYTTC